MKHGALPEERIRAVETGGCPHAAIREDISINLGPLEELSNLYKTDILLCESGGGNLESPKLLSLNNMLCWIILTSLSMMSIHAKLDLSYHSFLIRRLALASEKPVVGSKPNMVC